MDSFITSLREIADTQAIFLILVLLIAIQSLRRVVKNGPIEFWQFYATKTRDGEHYADANKLGIVVGIFASTLFVGYSFWAHEVDNWYIVTVFALWLTFIAGSEYFSKWFRTIASKVAEKKLEEKKD